MKSSSSPSNSLLNGDKFHHHHHHSNSKRDRRGGGGGFFLGFKTDSLSPAALFLSIILATLIILFLFYSPNPLIKIHQNDVDKEECDISKGRWIPDEGGPQYTNTSCKTIPDSKNCFRHGRRDKGFLNWRWKPDGCDLPRFDATQFLQMLRGKTMAFIGDSVARNHIDSFICLLSQVETPIVLYKDSNDRFGTWRFPSHNFILKILWTQFLVEGQETKINGSETGNFEVHLDRVDDNWARETVNIDYAVISSAHWFFRKIYVFDGSDLLGCVYCTDPNVTSFGPEHALRLAMRATFNHINTCRNSRRMATLVRTFSPAHFENGTWNTGGKCSRTRPYEAREINMESSEWSFRNMQVEEVERANKIGKGRRFGVLDVTRAMMMRPDGHPGEFWGNKWMHGFNDCVHWCMPGPIDVWNDFMMASIRRWLYI